MRVTRWLPLNLDSWWSECHVERGCLCGESGTSGDNQRSYILSLRYMRLPDQARAENGRGQSQCSRPRSDLHLKLGQNVGHDEEGVERLLESPFFPLRWMRQASR